MAVSLSPALPIACKQVLDLCGLSPILLSGRSPAVRPAPKQEVRRFSSSSASFEVMESAAEKALSLQRIGDPGLLKGCRFSANDCRTVAFPPATFGFGLGAFGDGFEDSQTRFGEFLAVDGSAAYLPTDGTNVPDFMVSSGELVPEINVLYGLQCEGGFTHLARFESTSADSPITLAELVRSALEISGAPAIGMVMVAESAGLVGAALRRSPAAARGVNDAPFKYPEVRSWLSFSTERLYSRSLALISGVAAGSECASACFPASAAGSRCVAGRTFSCRGIFLSSAQERGDRSESHGDYFIREGNFAGRTPLAGRPPRNSRTAAERVRSRRVLDQCGG